jgi:peptidoglycan hydrolase CwlO-like protein
MKIPGIALRSIISPVTFLLAFAGSHLAFGETDAQPNAQALLEEAKKSEFDRRMAAKETEASRLGEDLKKRKQEIDELDKSIYKVGGATKETSGQLDQLGAEKKRLTQELDLVNLRIEAEKLKMEGLMLLGIAHAKSRDALVKRTSEIELRRALVAAEIQQLSGKPASENPAPVGKGPGKMSAKASSAKATPGITDLRTQLGKAEQATATATSNARVAMESAALKLKQAEAAAAKAEKKHEEIALEKNPSFPGGNDPLGAANR